MYSTSSGRGFLPLVTAAHEISPSCSCMCNPGEEECMIHICDKDPFNAASFDLEFDLDAILDHTDFSTQEVSAMATELEKVSEHPPTHPPIVCVCVCG